MSGRFRTLRNVCLAGLAFWLAGCNAGAAATPIIIYVTAEPSTAQVSASRLPATADPTRRPTPSPEPTVDADLSSACDAISAMRGMGDDITGLVDAAFNAFQGGSYSNWADEASGTIAAVNSLIALLDGVPNREPYQGWKASVLEIMLHLSSAVVAYDTGITDDSLTQMNKGNAELQEASDLTDSMNTFAAEFESGC